MEGGLSAGTAGAVGLSLPGSGGRGSGGSHDMISVPEAAGGLSTDQPGRPAHSGGKVGRGSGGIHPVAIVASVVAVDRLNGGLLAGGGGRTAGELNRRAPRGCRLTNHPGHRVSLERTIGTKSTKPPGGTTDPPPAPRAAY